MKLDQLREQGFQCFRALVPRPQIPAIIGETDRLRTSVTRSESIDSRLRPLWSTTGSGKRVLRGLQDAHRVNAAIDALRLHPGIGEVLRAVLGPDIRTVVTSLFWKEPGEAITGIGYHQDAAFRQPATAYRNLAQSYLQLAIALDPQDAENGGLHFIPGSHRETLLFPRTGGSVLMGDAGDTELRAFGIAPEQAVAIRLEPGDAVAWNAFTLHGSPPNRSTDRDRRSFTIASMRAEDCDAGVMAYSDGRAVPAFAH